MPVMTAQELADHAQDAFENNIMDDPTPYEMGRAWKAVGERLFEILAERAEEERAPEIACLVNQLDAIRHRDWLNMPFEMQDALDAAADTLNRQAAEIKQLRETIEMANNIANGYYTSYEYDPGDTVRRLIDVLSGEDQ